MGEVYCKNPSIATIALLYKQKKTLIASLILNLYLFLLESKYFTQCFVIGKSSV